MIRLQDQETLQNLNFKSPATWIATWFGCGLMRPAPGTWGTLGGLPFGIVLLFIGGPIALFIGLLFILPFGFWSAITFERMSGKKDSPMIVIDEVAGLWIALLPVALTPLSVALAFILFRAFDILKPWPVSWLDQELDGSAGVMMDDMMAGIYTAIIIIGLRYVGFG